MYVCVYVAHIHMIWIFVTPWTVARQAPLSMGFSRQEYWSGVPFLPPGGVRDVIRRVPENTVENNERWVYGNSCGKVKEKVWRILKLAVILKPSRLWIIKIAPTANSPNQTNLLVWSLVVLRLFYFFKASLTQLVKLCRRPQFDSWVRKIRWRRVRLPTPIFLEFPGGSAGKESACSVGDLGSIPGLGGSPGEGKGYPLQYSGLEKSMKYSMGLQRVEDDFPFHFFYFFKSKCRKGKKLSVCVLISTML